MTEPTSSAPKRPRVRQRSRREKQPGAWEAECKPLPQRWRKDFLAKLAETSNVSRACEHAGVGPRSVYDLRRRDPGFAEKWAAALCEGYDNLELEMLHHLRSGESTASGASRFNFAAAVRMLLAHRDAVAREKGRRTEVGAAEIRESIDRKVAQMRQRIIARRARTDASLDEADDDEA